MSYTSGGGRAEMLDALGISPSEEKVYRALIASPEATVAAVAEATALPAARVRKLLASLETKGLVSRTPGKRSRYLPAPPAVAWEVLIQQRQAELDRARLLASEFDQEFRSASRTRSADLVEVVTGRDAVGRRFEQLLRLATEELIAFDKPPYVAHPYGPSGVEEEALERGVKFRVIYDRDALAFEGKMGSIQSGIRHGEEARTTQVPMKLIISDRRVALLPISLHDPQLTDSALLVYTSSLLDALVALWGTFWESAIPLGQTHDIESREGETLPLEERESQTVDLLLAGLKQEAIARQLGVSRTTVARDIAALLEKLHAPTRFQAGYRLGRASMARVSNPLKKV